MARDELMELLAGMRQITTLGEVRDALPQLHSALSDIQRKRSHFVEDACAVVLSQSFKSIRDGDDDDEDRYGPQRSVDDASIADVVGLCMAFAEPLVGALPPRDVNESDEILRERAVVVAFLLSVLGREELAVESSARGRQVAKEVVNLIVRCGLDFHTIAWTLRLREELETARSMLMPGRGNDGDHDEDEDEDNDDDDDDDADDDGDQDADEKWIIRQLLGAAGWSSAFDYFIRDSGQEYAFASWSTLGVVRFITLGLAVLTTDDATLVDVISPYSTLFAVGAAAQGLLQGQTTEIKLLGLETLRLALARCPPNGLSLHAQESQPGETTSLGALATAHRHRDWVSPLIELSSNVMVSFPEQQDRTTGLHVFRQLLQIMAPGDRFWMIRRLVLRCPYGNVSAILVDQLRSDVVRAWSPTTAIEESVYRSVELSRLIVDLLQLLRERDLQLHSDLLASVTSLIRFITIRDKENLAGLGSAPYVDTTRTSLLQLHSRLRATIAEVTPAHADHSAGFHTHDDSIRFILVEAALNATLDLLVQQP